MSDGTGIVHQAPAFGEDDARVGRKYDAPFVQLVDEQGRLKEGTPFAGMRCKPTQEEMDKLRQANEDFKIATESTDTRKIAEADVAFHDIIVVSTRNDRLIQLVNNLAEQMYRYRFEYLKDYSQHQMLVKEHQEMYHCILNKDKETAAGIASKHIANQEEAIIKSLQLECK